MTYSARRDEAKVLALTTDPEPGSPDTKTGARWAVPCVLVTVVIWGSYFPVVEALLRGWEPLTLTGARAILAAGTLVGLLVIMEGRAALHVGVPWRRVWALGSIGMAGNMTIIVLGIQVSGAVPAALIAGTTPALAAVMARFLLGQRLTGDLWIAVSLAVVGVAVVVLGGPSLQASFGGGELLVLVAYVLWLWYLFMAQLWLPGMSQLRVTALTMATGAATMAVLLAVLGAVGYGPMTMDLAPDSVALLVYSAVFSVAIGVLLWMYGVSHLGVTVTALYGNLVPIVAVAMSAALGAAVSWLQALGGALVLAGVIYIQLRPRLRHPLAVPRHDA